MIPNKRFCPHCKSTDYTTLQVIGSEYSGLISNDAGGVTLSVCLHCGTCYLDQFQTESIRRIKSGRIQKWTRGEEK